MSRAGDVFENPVTGERAVVVLGTEETNGERIIADLFVRPGGAVVGAHVHPATEERFTVTRGRVGFRINGRDDIAEPGRTLHVPAGVVHDWWNAGDEEAHVRVEIAPGARFEEMILTLFGLAQDGKTDAKGMPGLLQLALIAREFEDVIVFVSLPRWVQKIVFGVLVPLARLRGYQGSYPEYRERMLQNRQPREQPARGGGIHVPASSMGTVPTTSYAAPALKEAER